MLYGFRNGGAEAIRRAKQYAAENGMAELNCVDAQHYAPPRTRGYRERGLVTWTVRFDGLPSGTFDDGSVVLLVNLESGEVRTLGRPRPDLRDRPRVP